MRKILAFICILLFGQSSYAQIYRGFDPYEVKDMIQLCNSFTYLDLYNDDEAILPEGYKKEFTSGTFGMDNKYQVYVKEDVAVLNFRGSTDEQLSWMANFKSAMIPAKGRIKIQNDIFDYDLANDTAAAVHSGYVLGLAYLHKSVLMQIKYLNAIGVYDIYITGHSQGGALAELMHAYLDRLPNDVVPDKNQFKTYAFANPMIGNKAFANEYNMKYALKEWSMSIINPADPIPHMPVSYKEESVMSPQGIASLFNGNTDRKEFMTNMFMQTFEKSATRYVQSMSSRAQDQIAKELGSVEMPEYVNDINYAVTGDRHELPPFEYPVILKDSTILKNDSLLQVLSVDPATGHFIDKTLYMKEPMFFQHKPHNYYVGILKTYFKEEYDLLEPKILPENL